MSGWLRVCRGRWQVDVDQCRGTASKFKVQAMPTFKLLHMGKEMASIQGANEAGLKVGRCSRCATLHPTPRYRRVAQQRRLRNVSKPGAGLLGSCACLAKSTHSRGEIVPYAFAGPSGSSWSCHDTMAAELKWPVLPRLTVHLRLAFTEEHRLI